MRLLLLVAVGGSVTLWERVHVVTVRVMVVLGVRVRVNVCEGVGSEAVGVDPV